MNYTPNELRELAGKLERVIPFPNLSIACERAAAYLREQAERQEKVEPDPRLIDSMAMRYRHDFGLLDEAEKNSTRRTMRQLWEEVAGHGFYHPAPQSAPSGYWLAPMEPTEAMQWDGRKARDYALGCKDDGIEGDSSNVMLQVYRAMRDAYIASPAIPTSTAPKSMPADEDHTWDVVDTYDGGPYYEAVEPAAWTKVVEQRLLTWRQRFVNRSGDQLTLDDFMDQQSLDDLIDYVCDAHAAPAAPAPADAVEALRALIRHPLIAEFRGEDDDLDALLDRAVAALAAADQKGERDAQ